jgi:uncharacterized membrane protein YesL
MKPSNDPRFALPVRYWRLRPLQFIAIDVNDWLFRWMAVNLLWVLCSLTVILLPPATVALYEMAYQAYRGVPPEARRFPQRVKHWFIKSWQWGGANLLGFAAAFLLARAFFAYEILLAAVAALVALAVIGQFYFWPYVLIQPQPELIRALRNSIFTALGDLMYLTFYIAITVLIAVPAVITIAPLLFIAPAVIVMLSTYSLIGWLQQRGILVDEPRTL